MLANQAIEQMNREEMSALQLKKLKKQMKWSLEKSGFYTQKFSAAGIKESDINSIEDIRKLPFTTKEELRACSPYDLLTLPLSAVLRISRQGYTDPMIKMYTGGDLAYHIELMTRMLVAHGINNTTVVGLMGENSDSRMLDVQYALENIGATVMLMGFDKENIKELLTTCHVDVLISDYKLITQVVVLLQAEGISAKDLYLPKVICMEEGLHNLNSQYIEARFLSKISAVYNSPEIGCGGIMFSCGKGEGFHVQEDYFYPEIVEYGSDQVIEEPHHLGELVLTSLAAEAMPVFRYRTGHSVMRLDGDCPCGRTAMRVSLPYLNNI